jgi:hypothetical protein
MSVLIPVAADPTREARIIAARRQRRRRTFLIVGTLVIVASISALPLPVWKAREHIADRALTLRGWINDAQHEQGEVTAFRHSDGSARAAEAAASVQRWLVPHDALETRNLILKTARACGLDISSAELTPDVDPLHVETPAQQSTMVLGATLALAEPAPATATGVSRPLVADHYVVAGTGALSSLLLFCGVLDAMPAPLRLRSVRLEATDAAFRFTLSIDKVREGSAADAGSPAEPTQIQGAES